MAKKSGIHLPSGAEDAMLPGGNHIRGPRTARFSSMTVIPGTASHSIPGRPSTAQARGTIRGVTGMAESGKRSSKKQARGLGKGHSPMG